MKQSVLAYIPTLGLIAPLPRDSARPVRVLSNSEPLFSKNNRKFRVKRVLVLTNGCNLQCRYCFEGDAKNQQRLTPTAVEQILTEMFEEARARNRQLVSFSLFGGEPTLVWDSVVASIEVVKRLTKEYNIACRSAIVTNGLMSPDKASYLADNLDHVYLSLDGPQDIFLQQRTPKGGRDVFQTIFANAKTFYHGKAQLGLKTTVTKGSVDRIAEIMDFFNLHFPFTHQMYQPCMIAKGDPLYVSFSEFLAKFYIAKRNNPLGNMVAMPLLKVTPSNRFCNLHERRVVYPDGSILGCHRSNLCLPEDIVGKEFWQGTFVKSKIELDQAQLTKLDGIRVDNIQECQGCAVRYHCAGGCPAVKLFAGRDYQEKVDYCSEIQAYTLLHFLELLGIRVNNPWAFFQSKSLFIKGDTKEDYTLDRFLQKATNHREVWED